MMQIKVFSVSKQVNFLHKFRSFAMYKSYGSKVSESDFGFIERKLS